MTTPFLDFRLTVDGVEVMRERIDCSHIDEGVLERVGDRASALADRADDEGRTWVHEVVDPDGLMMTLRISNDPAVCNLPIPATPENLRKLSRAFWPVHGD